MKNPYGEFVCDGCRRERPGEGRAVNRGVSLQVLCEDCLDLYPPETYEREREYLNMMREAVALKTEVNAAKLNEAKTDLVEILEELS